MRRPFILLVILTLLAGLFPASVWADESETARTELTLQAAVDKALSINKGIRQAKNDLERSAEVRDYLADRVDFIPSSSSASSGAVKSYLSLTSAEISRSMAKRTLTVEEDKVVMSVYQAYNSILQGQEKVKVDELSLQNQQWLRYVASAGLRVGTIDPVAMAKAETEYTAAKATLEADNKALDDAYQKLNQLLGLSAKERPVLVDIPEIVPMDVKDLEAEVNKKVTGSPSVWLSEQQVDLAKLTKRLYDFTNTSNSEPYKAKEIDVEQKEISANDTKDQVAKLVRTIYYSATQLEEQYTGAKEAVRLAEENQRVTQVKYEVGMATKSDLLSAELALAQANQKLVDISTQHQILVLAFKKPWSYS